MMQSLVHRVICMLLAVNIFNFSVDVDENFLPAYDQHINTLDSFLELLLELGLDMPNAINEHTESGEGNHIKSVVFLFFYPNNPLLNQHESFISNQRFAELHEQLLMHSFDQDSPPPKV